MLRMQQIGSPGFKFQKFSARVCPPDPPIHAWYVGHTHGLPPLLYPLIYYLTESSLFKKCPPHGKILKRGPVHRYSFSYFNQTFPFLWSVMLAAPRLFLSLIWKFSNVRSFLSPTSNSKETTSQRL